MVDEEWFAMTTIPLQMASITRYQTGTAILRQAILLAISDYFTNNICSGPMVLNW